MTDAAKRRTLLSDILPLLIISITVLITATCYGVSKTSYNDELTEISSDWINENGESHDMDSLPVGNVTLSHDLNGVDLYRKRLCFISVDTFFTVSFDDEVTYVYEPEQTPILGKSYGTYVDAIPIPVDAKTVTLELHPVYKGMSATIKNIAVEDAGMFMGDVYHRGLPSIVICFLIFLFGVLMLVIGFTTISSKDGSKVSFFCCHPASGDGAPGQLPMPDFYSISAGFLYGERYRTRENHFVAHTHGAHADQLCVDAHPFFSWHCGRTSDAPVFARQRCHCLGHDNLSYDTCAA